MKWIEKLWEALIWVNALFFIAAMISKDHEWMMRCGMTVLVYIAIENRRKQ